MSLSHSFPEHPLLTRSSTSQKQTQKQTIQTKISNNGNNINNNPTLLLLIIMAMLFAVREKLKIF